MYNQHCYNVHSWYFYYPEGMSISYILTHNLSPEAPNSIHFYPEEYTINHTKEQNP